VDLGAAGNYTSVTDPTPLNYRDHTKAGQRAIYGAINRALQEAGARALFLPDRGFLAEPVNLLGAVWYSFAQEVHGLVRTARCPWCGHWYQVHHGRMVYCSKACRQNAFYHRNFRYLGGR
jgi:hypothetical protein